MDLTCRTITELPDIASAIVRDLGPIRVVLLKGDLGAGKTALVQAICQILDVADPVTSPTFSLVNQYYSPDHGTIYHIDLYRLESLEEAIQIGLEEYVDSDVWCFIEWPEIADALLRAPYAEITIEAGPDASRKIRILKQQGQ